MDCGGCTFCCLVLPVPSLGKKAADWCEHCDIGKGCRIWHLKPDDCGLFRCAYHQAPKCSTDLRPDKCRVLFERKGNTMFGTMHPRRGLGGLKRAAKGQVVSFLREGLSVVLLRAGKIVKVLPAPGSTAPQVLAEYRGVAA